MKPLLVSLLVLMIFISAVFGCGDGGGGIKDGVPFSIQVDPVNREGHPLGNFDFSVTATSEETRKAINISASTEGAEIKPIEPIAIMPGEVAKIIVVPFAESTGMELIITIQGERDGIVETTTAKLFVGTES